MDDLFGDSEPVHSHPVAPLKGLAQKLDDLRENGCCQYAIRAGLHEEFLAHHVPLESLTGPSLAVWPQFPATDIV